MPKGRTPPPRTPEQQKEHDRREALTSLDIPALRAWMAQYGMGAQGDDTVVLRAAHETRVIDLRLPITLRRESVAWLKEHAPNSTAIAQHVEWSQSRKAYGKRAKHA